MKVADALSAGSTALEGIDMHIPHTVTVHGRRAPAGALVLLALSLATSLAFVGSAPAATATPVLLGTTQAFAVLGGSGITNTGVSTIVGDVGSTPTSSETGFAGCPGANCVALTGANHVDPSPNDSATQLAKSDLTTAYDNAAGQTPTQLPTELAGLTLKAGAYNSASGTFGMSGTLVLDGQNNPDSIFIFQTASTLITGASGSVSLIGGAQACNVFWKVGSAATLGSGSTLVGTVLAHDDISLGDAVTVNGRLLAGEQASGAGAVTLIHDTITKPSSCLKATPGTSTSPTSTPTSKAAAAKSAPLTSATTTAAAKKLAAKKLAAKKAAAKKLAAKKLAAKKTATKKAATKKAASTTTSTPKHASTTITNATPKRPIHHFGLTG